MFSYAHTTHTHPQRANQKPSGTIYLEIIFASKVCKVDVPKPKIEIIWTRYI